MRNNLTYFLIITMVIVISFSGCSSTGGSENEKKQNTAIEVEKTASVEMLSGEVFSKKVFDFKNEKTWKYLGGKPCIVDFYADWCAPCRKVAPIMDELAKTFDGKVYFYKVNVDFEKELANAFGISSIPALLFCPMSGDPQMTLGLYPKDEYIKIINEFLLNQKTK